MVKVGYVQGVYQRCLDNTYQFLNDQGFTVTYGSVKLQKNGQNLVVTLVEPLYFIEWPYLTRVETNGEPARTSKKLDILAEVTETIRLNDGHCVRSTLRLNYFRLEGDKRIACEAIRYDFNATVQKQHPVCHAQLSNSIVEVPERFPETYGVESLAHRHQAIRIPTAFVNLAGLFAKLTADHLPADTVSEFWSTCKSYIDDIPAHASNEVFDEIFSGTSLRSYSWYRW